MLVREVIEGLEGRQAEEIRAELDPRQWTVLGNRLALIEEGLRVILLALLIALTYDSEQESCLPSCIT